jgi:hypothetical protein
MTQGGLLQHRKQVGQRLGHSRRVASGGRDSTERPLRVRTPDRNKISPPSSLRVTSSILSDSAVAMLCGEGPR